MKTALIVVGILLAVIVLAIAFTILSRKPAEESSLGNSDPVVVKSCKQDSDCPAGLWCGKGLHPAPGTCSEFPGAW